MKSILLWLKEVLTMTWLYMRLTEVYVENVYLNVKGILLFGPTTWRSIVNNIKEKK